MPKKHQYDLKPHHTLGIYCRRNDFVSGKIATVKLDTITDQGTVFKPKEHTIIMLPGTRVNHEMPQVVINDLMIPALIGTVKNTADKSKLDKSPNIFCVAYGHNDEQSISDHFSDHRIRPKNGRPAGTDVIRFVDTALMPIAGFTKKSSHPPVKDICDNLSRLTLIAHSYGTAFAREAATQLHKRLVERGYEADADRIVQEVAVVAVGNMSRIDRSGFRTVTFSSTIDPTAWDTAGRMADDHLLDGARQGSDRLDAQRRIYDLCGLDHRIYENHKSGAPMAPQRATGNSIHPHKDHLDSEYMFTGHLPEELHWTKGKNARSITPTTQREDGEKLAFAIKMERSKDPEFLDTGKEPHAHGVNNEPLVRDNLAVQHDHRMFTQETDSGNLAMVDRVAACLGNCISRRPLSATELRPSVEKLATATPPGFAKYLWEREVNQENKRIGGVAWC